MTTRFHSKVHDTVAWASLCAAVFAFAFIFNTCVGTQNTLASLPAGSRSVRRTPMIINTTCAASTYATFTSALKTAVDAHAAAIKTALDARQAAYVAALTNAGADQREAIEAAQKEYQAAVHTANQARMLAGRNALNVLQLAVKTSCPTKDAAAPPANGADDQQ